MRKANGQKDLFSIAASEPVAKPGAARRN